MTQRERSLLLVVLTVGGFVVLFGGFISVQNLLAGLDQKDEEIDHLRSEVSTNETRLLMLGQAQAKLQRWRVISLPPDLETAVSRYRAFLQDLCRRNQLQVRQLRESASVRTSAAPRTANSFTPLTYQLQVRGTLSQFINFLAEFYSINLPHLIREITITAPGKNPGARLDIVLKIEALALPDAPSRDALLATPDLRVLCLEAVSALKQGPTGLALGPWLLSPVGAHGARKLASLVVPGREYPRLVTKNIFAGLKPPSAPLAPPAPDPEVLKLVELTTITTNSVSKEASLRNGKTGRRISLREEPPFNAFEVRDGNDRVVLKGQVQAVNRRHVEFTAGGKRYHLSMGQNLYEALRPDRLSAGELQALSLNPRAGPEKP
jgi:hypothetical protein